MYPYFLILLIFNQQFPCPGSFTVDFVSQYAYFLTNCTRPSPILESISFSNQSTSTPLDNTLTNLVSISATTPYTPFLCGSVCTNTSDCAMAKTCNVCRDKRCVSSGTCDDYCLSSADCYSSCNKDCELNRCGRRGCHSPCNTSADCVVQSRTCVTCRGGFCLDNGACGAYCTTPLDCYIGGQCSQNCINFSCSL